MSILFFVFVGYCIGVLFPSTWLRQHIVNVQDKIVGVFKNTSNKN